MIRRFIRWALGVTREIEHLQQQLKDEKEARIREDNRNKDQIQTIREFLYMNTTHNVDVHLKAPHQCIVIGSYRGRDYIRLFHIPNEDGFSHLVEVLRRMEGEGMSRPGRFDVPMNMSMVLDQLMADHLRKGPKSRVRVL